MELLKRFVQEEEGQGLVEYALIIGLIAIVAALLVVLQLRWDELRGRGPKRARSLGSIIPISCAPLPLACTARSLTWSWSLSTASRWAAAASRRRSASGACRPRRCATPSGIPPTLTAAQRIQARRAALNDPAVAQALDGQRPTRVAIPRAPVRAAKARGVESLLTRSPPRHRFTRTATGEDWSRWPTAAPTPMPRFEVYAQTIVAGISKAKAKICG